ncbi:hypothetical protein EJB05_09625, partial [Eragrostis curvula]
MAGRFVLRKFSSETSRSMSFLAARSSASSRAAAPVVPRSSEAGIKTLSNVFHGAADHPGTAVPCASELKFQSFYLPHEAGIRTRSNVLHRDAVHPGTAILIRGNNASMEVSELATLVVSVARLLFPLLGMVHQPVCILISDPG